MIPMKNCPASCALIALLDRTIALLMTAIVLTLAWPVGLALWGHSHAAQDAGSVCRSASDAPLPSRHLPAVERTIRAI